MRWRFWRGRGDPLVAAGVKSPAAGNPPPRESGESRAFERSRDGERLNLHEMAQIRDGRCPDCLGNRWFEGSSGGLSTNYTCQNPSCGSRFNLALPFLAERISDPQPLARAVGGGEGEGS